jgi:hypothetical protein
MAVLIKEVKSKKELKDFIYVPEKIHEGHKNWLPPIYMDEKKFYNPEKNISFRGCDYRFIVAYKDGKPVGRCLGIIHHKHNQKFNLRNVRFFGLECYYDQETAHALISDIEQWGKDRGMDKIIGPFGFSDRDTQGFAIEGFENPPVVDSACNMEYMPELMVKEGFEKEMDFVIYSYPLTNELPEIYHKMYQRVIAKKDFEFIEVKSRKQLKPLIIPVLRLVNESFKDLYGFSPMDDDEMLDLAKRYLPILDPKFVKLVMKDGEVAAFMVSMANPYKGIQKSKGRLLPFGIFHILHALRHAESINLMLGAVKPIYQKQGLDLFITYTTIETARKAGMKSVDTHVVMEENDAMMAEFKRYNPVLYKKFRVYNRMIQ